MFIFCGGLCIQEKRMIALTEILGLTRRELNTIVEHIGNTPIKPVNLLIDGKARPIYLKLESENPTGSMKDRTGYALIQAFEAQGLLNQESVIVESTSGNLGVALAFICKARGYRFIAVVDPKTTYENITRMRNLGARIEMVEKPDDKGGYLLSRLKRVQELCQMYSNAVWTDQYANPANPQIHATCTGPEIYRQMDAQVDAVFVPVSTGGTLTGIGRFLREVSPSTRIIAVDAFGSVIFGTPPSPRKLTGIGSSRTSLFIKKEFYNEHILIKDQEAFACCRSLYATTGIKVGGSSGAVIAACIQYMQLHPESKRVVCVCADSGENYASTIFHDVWLHENGFVLPSAQQSVFYQGDRI
jgi:2,3-diaminopropionate biosynthesis protein SbnA